MKIHRLLALATLAGFAGLAHAATLPVAASDPSLANRANLGQALQAFLAQRGDICLAKYDWPIDVSARDDAARTSNALQMPVLEHQGLVTGRDGYVDYRDDETGQVERVPTRRYELTALGRKFFKQRDSAGHGPDGHVVVHHGDLCAGRLELAAITRIAEPQVAPGQPRTASVSYRYRFTAAPWAATATTRAVFPMIDLLIRKQDSLEMTHRLHFDGQRWVADAQLE